MLALALLTLSGALADNNIVAKLVVPPGTPYSVKAPERYRAKRSDKRYPLRAAVKLHLVRIPYDTEGQGADIGATPVRGGALGGASSAAIGVPSGNKPYAILRDNVRSAVPQSSQDAFRTAAAALTNPAERLAAINMYGQWLQNTRAARSAAYLGKNCIQPSDALLGGMSGIKILHNPGDLEARSPAMTRLDDSDHVKRCLQDFCLFRFRKFTLASPGLALPTPEMVEVTVEWAFQLEYDPDAPVQIPLFGLSTEVAASETGSTPNKLTDANFVGMALGIEGAFPAASQLPAEIKAVVGPATTWSNVQAVAGLSLMPEKDWPLFGWMRDYHMSVLAAHSLNGPGKTIAGVTYGINKYSSVFGGLSIRESSADVRIEPALGFAINFQLGGSSDDSEPYAQLQVTNGALAPVPMLAKEAGLVEFRYTNNTTEYRGHFETDGLGDTADQDIRVGSAKYPQWFAWVRPANLTKIVLTECMNPPGGAAAVTLPVEIPIQAPIAVSKGSRVVVEIDNAGQVPSKWPVTKK